MNFSPQPCRDPRRERGKILRKTKGVLWGFFGLFGSIGASVAFGQSSGNHEGLLFYDDGTEITITGQNLSLTSSESLVIPARIGGKPVTKIGAEAFSGLRSDYYLRIFIPATIYEIGDRAFEDCPMLTSVQFLGPPPVMGLEVFGGAGSYPTIFFLSSGFTQPTWQGLTVTRGLMHGYGQDSGLHSRLQKVAGNFTYYDLETEIIITGTVEPPGGKLIIPAEIDGKPVRYIGYEAFFSRDPYGHRKITELILPETLEYIDKCAFNGQNEIWFLRIPDSVEEIGVLAFTGWSNLTSLYIGSGVKKIGPAAFSNAASLESVHLGNALETIGAAAFFGAALLKGVTIPASVTAIEYGAFAGCRKLEVVQFLGDAPEMGRDVWSDVWHQMKIYFLGTGFTTPYWPWPYDSFQGLSPTPISSPSPEQPPYLAANTLRYRFYSGDRETWEGYFPPDRVEVSGYNPDVPPVGELVIPKKLRGLPVSGIQDYALRGADQITSVVIPAGLKKIGQQAFAECRSLERITIEEGATSEMEIGAEAFFRLPALTTVTLGKGVRTIGERAFEFCPSLTSIVIPAGVEIIGQRAFAECERLEEINLERNSGNAELVIGSQAFAGLPQLTSLIMNYGVKEIGERAFADCPLLTSVEIPLNTATIGERAFSGCDGLTSVTIQGGADGRLKIEENAFAWLQNLSALSLGEGIREIGPGAFYGCPNLTSVVIPASVKTIGSQAFEACKKLTHVSILGSKSTERLVGGRAFFDLPMLETVELGEGIREIGRGAFAECPKLASIRLPNSLGILGNGAFHRCTSLETVDFGTGLREIGYAAFEGCGALVEVDLPASLREIGDCAFYGATSLSKLTLREGLASIGREAFSGNNLVRSLRLPNSLLSIGSFAFAESTALESVSFGRKLSEIGERAFASCSQLRVAFFGGNAPTMEEGVFRRVHPTFAVYTTSSGFFGPGWSDFRIVFGGLPTAKMLRVFGVEEGELSPRLGGIELNIGQRYTVTARPRAGWVFLGWKRPGQPISLDRKLTFTMEEWLTLEPIYLQNRLPEMAGFYNGLVLSAEDVQTGAEFFAGTGWVTLAVNARGGFTGTVLHGGQRMAVRGAFGLEGKARVMLKLRGQNYGELALAMDFATGEMTGEFGEGLVLSAVRNGYSRKRPHPLSGARYQVALERESEGLPVNSGEVSLAIAFDGKTKVAGRLADGSVLTGVFGLGPGLTESPIENPTEQSWTLPVFIPLYQGAVGLLAGEAEISGEPGTMLTGELGWFCAEGARLPRSRQSLAGHFSSLNFAGGN